MISVKYKPLLAELTVQVWPLYDHSQLNIELKMGWNNGQTDRRMIQLLHTPSRFVRPGAYKVLSYHFEYTFTYFLHTGLPTRQQY